MNDNEAESHKAGLLRYIHHLQTDYQEMYANPSQPVVYDTPSTPLEALRMIHRSRPAIIRGYNAISAKGKEKALDWNIPETYLDIIKEEVTIAVTEDGLADSVQTLEGGEEVFVKPLNEEMALSDFFDRLSLKSKEIVYLQSQDGNIYRYPPRPGSEPQLRNLQAYVESEVSWMEEALGSRAEAVNLWIGSNRSVTSFHHDPFENIYHVLSGTKTFCLVSPIEGLFFNQRFYPQYTLTRTSDGSITPTPDPEPTYPVPWVESLSPPPEAIPIEVEVKAGETLYLPAGWWHRVSQFPGPGGLAVAVNYWYPSEPDAQVHSYERLARRVARQGGMGGVIAVPGDEEEEDEEDADEGDIGEVVDAGELEGIWANGDGEEGEGDSESGEEWDPKEWGR